MLHHNDRGHVISSCEWCENKLSLETRSVMPNFFQSQCCTNFAKRILQPHYHHAPIELLIVDRRSALSCPSLQLLPSTIMICSWPDPRSCHPHIKWSHVVLICLWQTSCAFYPFSIRARLAAMSSKYANFPQPMYQPFLVEDILIIKVFDHEDRNWNVNKLYVYMCQEVRGKIRWPTNNDQEGQGSTSKMTVLLVLSPKLLALWYCLLEELEW